MSTTEGRQPIDRDGVDLTKAVWRKAAASGGNGGGCMEFAPVAEDVIAVRDSKDAAGPVLLFSRHEVWCMLDGAKAGEFDDLARRRAE
jgi:hypothetical protein